MYSCRKKAYSEKNIFVKWKNAKKLVNSNCKHILKDKISALLKIKIHIKASSGWILFKFSQKIDVCVYNTLANCMRISRS